MASHNIKPLVYKKALGGSRPKDGLMTGAQVDDLAAAKTHLSRLWLPDNASGTDQVTNLDTLDRSGFYDAAPGATGTPNTSYWWHVIHKEHTGLNGYSWQLAAGLDGTWGSNTEVQHIIYQRKRYGGGWSAWTTVTLDTGWRNPAFLTGWTSWGGWPVMYRRVGDLVLWRGMLMYAGGGTTSILNFTANSFYSPPYSVMYRGAASAGDGTIAVGATGYTMTTGLGTLPPVNNWLSLAGLYWTVN